MIALEDILILHHLSIEEFWGTHGIRDEQMLMSAIERPFQTFDSIPLYKSTIEQAAALGESLIINHPFIDGNKRTGMLAMLALLKTQGINLSADADNLYNCIISISTGEKRFDGIVEWLRANSY